MATNQKLYSLDRIRRMANEAAENPAKFWVDKAEYLTWFERPKSVLEGKAPDVYWFRGGYLNIAYNAVDRHIPAFANRVAFYYENERGESKIVSYWDLYRGVNRATYVLKELGVKKGDTVSMMFPSIPEAVFFGLAVHRLGATLVIHYAGLSEETLAYRLQDCGSKVFVVVSKGFRAGEEVRMNAVVGVPVPGGSEKVLAFMMLKSGETPSEALVNDIKEFTRASGVRVDDVVVVRRLPKTKSGKIMRRRLLRALVRNGPYGDISTLDDIRTLDDIKVASKEKGYMA